MSSWIDDSIMLYRNITVQPIQLALAMHEVFPCAFSHNPKHKKYIEPERCPALSHNRELAMKMLGKAEQMSPIPYSVKTNMTSETP